MSQRLMNALLILSLVGILGLFLTNFLPMLRGPIQQKFVDYQDVNGIDVTKGGSPWTLNFKQQNDFLDRLNQSILIKKADYQPTQEKFSFDSITIHRFKDKDIVLKPIGKKNKNIVFTSPQISENAYVQDVSEGNLLSFIETTYDK